MAQKNTTSKPRNYLVKLALFRKAGSHKKSNKAIRRLEKSKKSSYSEVYLKSRVSWTLCYQQEKNGTSILHYNNSGLSIMDNTAAF